MKKRRRYGKKGKFGALNDLGNVIINNHLSKGIIKNEEIDFRIPLERTEENASLFEYDHLYESEEIEVPENAEKRKIEEPLGDIPNRVVKINQLRKGRMVPFDGVIPKDRNTAPLYGFGAEKWLEWASNIENWRGVIAIAHGIRQMQPIPLTQFSIFYDSMDSVMFRLSTYDIGGLLAGIGSYKIPETALNFIKIERGIGIADNKRRFIPDSLERLVIHFANMGRYFNFPIEMTRLKNTNKMLRELDREDGRIFFDILSRFNASYHFNALVGDKDRSDPWLYNAPRKGIGKITRTNPGLRYMKFNLNYFRLHQYKDPLAVLQRRSDEYYGISPQQSL